LFISWRICFLFLRWTNFCIHVMVSQWVYFMFPFVNFLSFSIFKVGYVQIMTKFIFKWRKGKHILCTKLNSRFTCMQLDLPFILVFMIILSLYYDIEWLFWQHFLQRFPQRSCSNCQALVIKNRIFRGHIFKSKKRKLIGPVLGGSWRTWLAFQCNRELWQRSLEASWGVLEWCR